MEPKWVDYRCRLIKWIQHDVQEWYDFLKVTDSTLDLLKCFFQVIFTTLCKAWAHVIAAHEESWYIDIKDKTNSTMERVILISSYTTYTSLGITQGIYKI